MSPLTPVELVCEGMVDPLGIDLERGPLRLGWRLHGEGRARGQTAYQLQAATSPGGLLDGELAWDPGKVVGDAHQWVPWRGPRLRSRDRVAWRVRTWDEADRAGPWSEPATFEMGLLRARDWAARWIAPWYPPPQDEVFEPPLTPAPLLRTEVDLPTTVRVARAYLCGVGFHELWINGRRVGDAVLEPVFTRYDRRVESVTHDVSAHLVPGRNAIGVILGRGWFDERARTPWWFAQAPWRTRVRVRLQVEVELDDGTRRTIGTDVGWRAHDSQILEDGVRTGEVVDGRRELPGWSEPGLDDRDWRPVHVVPGPGGRLVARTLPIEVTETVLAISVRPVRPGVHLVDVGRDISGWMHMRLKGPAGTRVTLRHGERLDADGDLDQRLLDRFHDPDPFQRDAYILRGGGLETFEPRFTFHGFRYVRVEGYPGEPDPGAFEARVVRSAFPEVGRFQCSEPLLESIHAAALASYRSNFVGFPMDCPHREKNGWLDAHLHAELGLYHFGAADGYRTWLDTMADCQRADGALPAIVPSGGWGYAFPPGDDVAGPAWDSACIQLPWTLYRFTGDRSILARHLPMMRGYLAHLASLATEGILGGGLGDWCPPGGLEVHRTPWALTSTAFLHLDAMTLGRITDVLGRPAEAHRYRELARRVRDAFDRRFRDPDTGWYEGREMTAQAVPLAFGLVAEEHRERVVARLVDAVHEADHGAYFGILGARFVLRVLADHGHADDAFAIVNRTAFPGWGHWIAQGATTLWERWEGSDSQNHTMFGDVAAWMMAVLAGIRPDDDAPGFQRTIIEPHPVAGLDWAAGEHESAHGRVRSAWHRKGRGLALEVEVPPGTSGLVRIPAAPGSEVREAGRPLEGRPDLRLLGHDRDRLLVEVGSGTYRFAIREATHP